MVRAKINTSDLAEESLSPEIKQQIQREVLDYLYRYGPSIHQRMEQHFADRYGPSTIRARCAELVRLGWVRESGRYGLTRAKRRAIIWEVA